MALMSRASSDCVEGHKQTKRKRQKTNEINNKVMAEIAKKHQARSAVG